MRRTPVETGIGPETAVVATSVPFTYRRSAVLSYVTARWIHCFGWIADGYWQDNDLVGNTKRFTYSSCNAARATARLQIYFAWTNTWNDNVAVW